MHNKNVLFKTSEYNTLFYKVPLNFPIWLCALNKNIFQIINYN